MSVPPGRELRVGSEVGAELLDEAGLSDAGYAHDRDELHAVLVPAGTYHNVVNTSKIEMLKLYTIYSPPNHPDGTVHKTKAEAEAAELVGHS